MIVKQNTYLESFIKAYCDKTRNSKQKIVNHGANLADSRRCDFRMKTKEMLYPIIAKQASGSHFVDIDDNDFLDITMGYGALIFGHMPQFLKTALTKAIDEGLQLGPQAHLSAEVAQLICEFTGVDRVAFCNSGTEAVMTALRLARLKTNRQKVILFDGSYHGFYDATLAMRMPAQSKISSMPIAEGLPETLFEDIYVLPYLEEQALDQMQELANDIAAIIVEPVRSRFPTKHSKEFLVKLREFSSKHGIVLIFDEVVTGFRCHEGGAQAYFNIKADLATYGKALGGGLPIGIVAGRSDIMGGIDGGHWNYGDKSFPKYDKTFFAGTFHKNPLSIVAAHATLHEIKKHGPNLQKNLTEKTTAFANELNSFFAQQNVPIQMLTFASLFRLDIKQEADLFFYHLVFNNLYTWEGQTFYLSTAHLDQDIKKIVTTIKDVTMLFKEQGLIKSE